MLRNFHATIIINFLAGEIQKTTTSFKIHEPQIYLNSRKIKTEQPQDKNLVFSEKSNAQKNEDDMKWTETQRE